MRATGPRGSNSTHAAEGVKWAGGPARDEPNVIERDPGRDSPETPGRIVPSRSGCPRAQAGGTVRPVRPARAEVGVHRTWLARISWRRRRVLTWRTLRRWL